MKTVIAYLLVFFIGPILSLPLMLISGIVTGPALSWLGFGSSFLSLRYALNWCLISIATVGIGTLIFRFFRMTPTLLMVIRIGGGQVITDLQALSHPPPSPSPSLYIRPLASLIGLVLAGIIFLR